MWEVADEEPGGLVSISVTSCLDPTRPRRCFTVLDFVRL